MTNQRVCPHIHDSEQETVEFELKKTKTSISIHNAQGGRDQKRIQKNKKHWLQKLKNKFGFREGDEAFGQIRYFD